VFGLVSKELWVEVLDFGEIMGVALKRFLVSQASPGWPNRGSFPAPIWYDIMGVVMEMHGIPFVSQV
jgi:hypothetical protein